MVGRRMRIIEPVIFSHKEDVHTFDGLRLKKIVYHIFYPFVGISLSNNFWEVLSNHSPFDIRSQSSGLRQSLTATTADIDQ